MAIRKFNSEEGFSVGLYPSIDVIDINGTIIANDLTVTSNAYFGTITTVKVYGGSAGQVVTTDGLGNLSFSTVTSGGSAPQGVYGAIQWNDNGVLGGDSVLYYDPLTEILYSTAFSGDASQLSNISGPNVVGDVSNANYATFSNYAYYSNQADYANNVTASNQPNITTVGNLLNLSVDGNINIGGNANLGNTATANFFSGNGALLTYVNAAAVIGVVANANYAEFANVTLNSIESNTVTGSSQPNITELGTLTSLTVTGNSNLDILTANALVSNSSLIVNGDTTLLGNLLVYGNAVYTDVTTLKIKDPIIEMGGFPNGDPLTANDGFDRGSLLHYYTTTPVDAFIGWHSANAEFTVASNVSYVGNTITINELGNLRANLFLGNGAALTAITGANVTGAVANATYAVDSNNANFAGNVTVASQPNITSVGTLTSLSVTGNIDSGNANLGNIAIANSFYGNGYNLSYINGSNIVGTIGIAANAVSAQTANVSLSVSNSSQPNITEVGTLSTLSLSGTISGVNAVLNVVQANYFLGDGSNISALNASNIVGTVANANYAEYAGNVTESSQPNITSVGTLTTLTVLGNIVAANASLGNSVTANYFIGNASNLTNIPASNIVGIIANATYAEDANNANAALTAGTATTAGTVTTASQPNITSVGTLTSVSVSGNLTTGNANLGNTAIANFFIGAGNNLSNIQAANITGVVANATYAEDANNANAALTAVVAGTVTTAAQPNITSVGILTTLSVSGNITSGNANLGNLAEANFFTGTLTTNAQPNITNVGTLTSLSVTGNVDAGNINTTGIVSAIGNMYACVFIGAFSGPIVSNVTAPGNNYEILYSDLGNTKASPNLIFNDTSNALIVDGSLTVTGNVSLGNISAGNLLTANFLTGTLTTNAQPNITSLGLLTDLSVTGNITRNGRQVPTYVVQGGAPSSPKAGDQWYDTDNDRTYQYIYNGVTFQWVDISSGFLNANTVAVANTLVLRDLNGNVNANVFNGNSAVLTNLTVNTSLIGNVATFANAVYASGNVTQPNQLATKEYVDQQTAAGLHIHDPVKVHTTGNLIASYNNGGTALTITDITSNTTFTTSANHGLNVDDVIVPSTTSNGLTSGVAYFVFSTPALNQFILSTTFHGAQANTFTNGTSLTIGATGNPGLGATLTNAGTQAPLSIDNVNLTVGQRVLVIAQTNAYENGVYDVTTVGTISTNWVLTRSSDGEKYHPTDTFGLGEGDYFYVESGTTGSGDSFVLTTVGVIIIGTTNITFTLFSAAITYVGVSPVVITGQQISLANLTGTGDVVVLSNTPTLITPNIGAATGTSLSLTGNLTSANANLGNLASANYFTGTLTTGTQPNITSIGILSGLSVTGNANIADINTGNINATGIVSAGGNGTFANISTGIVTASGNITGANILTSGLISATGNLDANNVNVGTILSAGGNITGANILTSGLISATGNLNSNNINVGNIISAGGNITGANLLTGGLVSITGNLDANNVNVGNILSAGGNITGSNLLTGGNVSATGNVNANNINLVNILSAGGNITGANITTGGEVSATGNLTGNNFIAGNIISAGGNITGSNLLTGGDVSATGNVSVIGNSISNNISVGNIVSIGGNLTAANANLGNNVSANYFTGNGFYLTDINVSSIGTVANANYAAYAGNVVNSTQANITSLGTLTGLSVSGNVNVTNTIGANNYKSTRSNVLVSTNTIIDQFTTTAYRTAKYILQAQGDIGYQSAEVLLIHDGSDSYITIYGSVYSNVEVIGVTSNVVSGNIRLYATAVGANTTVNLLSMYVLD
jgi:hypothetical protein